MGQNIFKSHLFLQNNFKIHYEIIKVSESQMGFLVSSKLEIGHALFDIAVNKLIPIQIYSSN